MFDSLPACHFNDRLVKRKSFSATNAAFRVQIWSGSPFQGESVAYDAQACYKCGNWKDDYPSSMCASCRARIHYENQAVGNGVALLAARLTPDDYAWLWCAGIRLDADLMNIPCTMTCPRCKNPVTKQNTEDPFKCGCGWSSDAKSLFHGQTWRDIS